MRAQTKTETHTETWPKTKTKRMAKTQEGKQRVSVDNKCVEMAPCDRYTNAYKLLAALTNKTASDEYAHTRVVGRDSISIYCLKQKAHNMMTLQWSSNPTRLGNQPTKQAVYAKQ